LVSLVKSLDPTLVPRTNATHEGPHARLLSNCLRTLINVSSAFDGRYDAVIQAQGSMDLTLGSHVHLTLLILPSNLYRRDRSVFSKLDLHWIRDDRVSGHVAA
jgi:hypothetical protein